MESGAPMFGSIGRRHGDQAGEVVIHFTGFFFFCLVAKRPDRTCATGLNLLLDLII